MKQDKQHSSLNPYSTGSNSNVMPKACCGLISCCLNPYSTGSNSNALVENSVGAGIVLILILLEVTQIL